MTVRMTVGYEDESNWSAEKPVVKANFVFGFICGV